MKKGILLMLLPIIGSFAGYVGANMDTLRCRTHVRTAKHSEQGYRDWLSSGKQRNHQYKEAIGGLKPQLKQIVFDDLAAIVRETSDTPVHHTESHRVGERASNYAVREINKLKANLEKVIAEDYPKILVLTPRSYCIQVCEDFASKKERCVKCCKGAFPIDPPSIQGLIPVRPPTTSGPGVTAPHIPVVRPPQQ